MWEDEFTLLYHISGMTSDRVSKMSFTERQWWITRLGTQKRKEREAMTVKEK